MCRYQSPDKNKSHQIFPATSGVFYCHTAKELKGELPEDVEVNVKEIQAPFTKNAPFKYISNVEGVS